MKTQLATQQYGDIIAAALTRKLLASCTQTMQPRIQPMLNEQKPASEEKFRIASLQYDQATETLLLRVQGSVASLQVLARAHLVTLFLRYQHQLHQSEAVEVIKAQISSHGLILRTCVPETLNRVFQRAHFRVHLPSSLKVQAEVRHLGQRYQGELVDLSFGGCRIALPMQNSLLLGIEPAALQVKITFPNGESFAVKTEKVTLLPNAEFCKALLGCRFEHPDERQGRQVMRYILETEREVARLSRSHQRNLLPSALFQTEQEEGQEVHLGEPSYQPQEGPSAARLINCAGDQISGQALVVLAKGTLSGQELQKVAGQLVDACRQDRDGLLWSLTRAEALHPLVGHTLKVAVRFFGLANKMGISHHYDQALMAALLVQDMARLLTSSAPCSDLSALELSDPHAYKAALLQVIRALAKLKWIPRSLGESLIVNANEKMDGSGFPRGLKADRLDSLSRGLSLVKALTCMTTGVGQQERLTWQEAYEQVRRQPYAYDLSLLDSFIKLNGLYPVGSCIAFEKGYRAWVTQVDNQGQPSEVELMTSAPQGEGPVAGERVTSQYARSLGQIIGEVQF